jgi:hypothetical protein
MGWTRGKALFSSPPSQDGGEVARAKPVTERGTMVQKKALKLKLL